MVCVQMMHCPYCAEKNFFLFGGLYDILLATMIGRGEGYDIGDRRDRICWTKDRPNV